MSSPAPAGGSTPANTTGPQLKNGTWNGWPWDFSDFPHDDYGPQVNYAIWLMTSLAAVFLGLRVYCKYLHHRGLWYDDHILIVSWVALLVQTSMITFNTTIGYGKHIWDFHPSDLSTFLLVSNTSGFFSILAAMWSKTSFAITVLRISDGWVKKVIWFIIVSVNVTLGFGALSTYIQCAPVQKLWNPLMPGTCWPKEVIIRYNMFTAAYSGAMDIVLAILPWKIIWPLTMNKREKIGVLLAMNMGVFAGITSFAKITQLPAINKFDLIDGIWLSILGTAESATTIMAASIPVLRALVKSHSMRAPPVRLYGSDTEIFTGNMSTIRQSIVTSKGSSPPRSIFSSSLWSKKTRRADHNQHGIITGSATRGIVRTESVSVVWEPDTKEDIGRAF